MARTRAKHVPGYRQQTLLDAGIDPTPDLINVEVAECRALWRRTNSTRIRTPDIVREVAFRVGQRRAVGL